MVAKGEPTGMGKFSPRQQPEGPAPYELGIMLENKQVLCT